MRSRGLGGIAGSPWRGAWHAVVPSTRPWLAHRRGCCVAPSAGSWSLGERGLLNRPEQFSQRRGRAVPVGDPVPGPCPFGLRGRVTSQNWQPNLSAKGFGAEPPLPKFISFSSFRKRLLGTSCMLGTVPATGEGRPKPHRADIQRERVNMWANQVAVSVARAKQVNVESAGGRGVSRVGLAGGSWRHLCRGVLPLA